MKLVGLIYFSATNLFTSTCAGQVIVIAKQSEINPTIGFSQFGSSGLFVNPSPLVMGTGQTAVGISYQAEFGSRAASSLPLAFAFGTAKNLEGFVSFATLKGPENWEERYSTFGMKVKLNKSALHDFEIAADLRFHRYEVSFGNNGSNNFVGGTARCIMSHPISPVTTTYAHLGFGWVETTPLNIRSHFVGGLGLAVSLNENLITLAEVHNEERTKSSYQISTRLGIKAFTVQRIQIAAGFQANYLENKLNPGIFLGLSFSSEILKAGTEPDSETPMLPEPPPLEDLPTADSSGSSSMPNIEEHPNEFNRNMMTFAQQPQRVIYTQTLSLARNSKYEIKK